METTLHRQLKELYLCPQSRTEVTVAGYRIDVASDDLLIEIQCASLAALRDKLRDLTTRRQVLVVKPLACRKWLVKRTGPDDPKPSRRLSPRKETLLSVFGELVHLVSVFPHPRLTLEIVLTEQEEDRLPKVPRRRRSKNYAMEDRRLVRVVDRFRLSTAADLASLLPADLPTPFDSRSLAAAAGITRGLAQKMLYCLRQVGALTPVRRSRAGWQYERTLPAA